MMGLEHPFTATGRDPLGVSGAVAASEAPQGALVLWRRLERRPLMQLAPPGTCMLTHALLALQVPVPPAIARLFGAADGTSAAGSSAFDSDAVAFVGGEGAGGTQTATALGSGTSSFVVVAPPLAPPFSLAATESDRSSQAARIGASRLLHRYGPFSMCEKVALFRALAEVGPCWEVISATQLPGRARGLLYEFERRYHPKALDAQRVNMLPSVLHLLSAERREQMKAGYDISYPTVEYLLARRTRDEHPACDATEWSRLGLCCSGWPVRQCGRWVRDAGCGCKHLSESKPYGEEWLMRDEAAGTNEPLLRHTPMRKALVQPSNLPPGWKSERAGELGSYLVYVGPNGERARTKTKAREMHAEGGSSSTGKRLVGSAERSSSSTGSGSVCAACCGRHRPHTCGKRRASDSGLLVRWPAGCQI